MKISEGEDKFKALPTKEREELIKAIKILESNVDIKREYDETGLFTLSTIAKYCQRSATCLH